MLSYYFSEQHMHRKRHVMLSEKSVLDFVLFIFSIKTKREGAQMQDKRKKGKKRYIL